ncbi:hypothetical protein [uncultured Nocardioides sp.]|uniref:hypothetical protein n=1 Tax=uncultured Nocardioides sp. TaxID=198441 RepID=UPI00261F524C|nr:hypothetical protein [uncultured Nocardioides sp.]
MLFIVFAMFLILLVATAVVVFVAYPYRGSEVPGAPWFGDAVRRWSNRLKPLSEDEQRGLRDHSRR